MTARACFVIFIGGVLSALALVACSPPTATEAAPSPAGEQPLVRTAPAKQLSACEIVDAPTMTAILGAPVAAHSAGESKCTYAPGAGVGPYAELEIERGDGEVAMKAVGVMNRQVQGMVDPLAGVGDQAAQVGPAFFIRSGSDLVKVVVSGVDAPGTKVRAVFEHVKAKL